VPETVAPGRVLGGRYRLTNELARGGMATVWVAEDPLLSRRVAVKVLLPELAVDDALRTRFRNEAVAAAKLTHSAVVATYDTGDDNGVAYIVMQLVEGQTLRRLLDERGQLPVRDAVRIATQVADALEHAHRHGLVHRDIKPANVLVANDGQVKVTDFGIAKAIGAGDDLTRTGMVVGTARYLAPEQVNGDPVDGRADVYALGLVLYEMLTGSLPFAGDTEMATALARLTTAPDPVRRRRPEVPPLVDRAVDGSLARDPDDRFPSAGALSEALATALDSTPTPPSTPRGSTPSVAVVEPQEEHTVGIDRTVPQPPAAPPPTPHPPPAGAPVRRRGPARLFVALLLIGALGGAGFFGARAVLERDDESGGTPGGGAAPFIIVSGDDFDPPPGDGDENGDQVRAVFDDNPGNAWETQTYQAPSEQFGGIKDGVGFYVELDAPHDLSSIAVATQETAWSAEIYAADQPGDTLADWGPSRGSVSDAGTDETIDLSDDTRGRYVLLWLTRLPASGKLHVTGVQVA
jgi:tRNA A-37 threonylcarbamoyl transferase component Bud32